MNKYKCIPLFLLLMFSNIVQASKAEYKYEHDCNVDKNYSMKNIDISEYKKNEIVDSLKHTLSKKRKDNSIAKKERNEKKNNPLTNYVVNLPHTTQPKICRFEKILLENYLENPDNTNIMYMLAYYHANKSLVFKNKKIKPGRALRHTIIAEYFLSRIGELGESNSWTRRTLSKIKKRLRKLLSTENKIDLDEHRNVHKYFIEAFNYKEQNRYLAANKLLGDLMENSNNVFTLFALTAVNSWIGGEADYDDPSMLYNIILVGYFSQKTMNYAQKLEQLWEQAPETNKRFRLSTILGGFSALARRWLANVHKDFPAIKLIDGEHRAWRLIHRAFHSWTVGVAFFEDNNQSPTFKEGFNAWSDALPHCAEVRIRTCSNRPRLSHNFMGFVLAYVDFLLKAGDTNSAAAVLALRYSDLPEVSNYGDWELGRDAWEHRENNMFKIFELYQNNDPADDPMFLFLKKRKWGSSTSTCQICHQAQNKIWSEAEKNTIWLPPEALKSVGKWPVFTTTWYGSLISGE